MKDNSPAKRDWHGTCTRHSQTTPYKEAGMTKAQLMKKIAVLESINDQLSTEVSYVDRLMRLVGFSGGLETIKATAVEIIEKGYQEQDNE